MPYDYGGMPMLWSIHYCSDFSVSKLICNHSLIVQLKTFFINIQPTYQTSIRTALNVLKRIGRIVNAGMSAKITPFHLSNYQQLLTYLQKHASFPRSTINTIVLPPAGHNKNYTLGYSRGFNFFKLLIFTSLFL